VADLYRLRAEDLESYPRFGKKSASNLVDAIARSKETTLSRFLYALGIPHVGSHLAQLLADHFQSIDLVMKATAEELTAIAGVGEVVAFSVLTYFRTLRTCNWCKTSLPVGYTSGKPVSPFPPSRISGPERRSFCRGPSPG